MNKLRLKQFIDSLLSFGGLIVFMSFMFLIGLAVFIDMGSPIIFSQLRLGKDGKPFYLYKFRTMLELKDDKGNYLPDEKRLTVFGRF
jgi:sugar transferase EpsL